MTLQNSQLYSYCFYTNVALAHTPCTHSHSLHEPDSTSIATKLWFRPAERGLQDYVVFLLQTCRSFSQDSSASRLQIRVHSLPPCGVCATVPHNCLGSCHFSVLPLSWNMASYKVAIAACLLACVFAVRVVLVPAVRRRTRVGDTCATVWCDSFSQAQASAAAVRGAVDVNNFQ